MHKTFYAYQHARLGDLLAWGLGSVAAGLLLPFLRDPLRRGIADQSAMATTNPAAESQAAISFRRILAINAALDVGYVLGGLWLVQAAGPRRSRRGLGTGIAIQGLFLLLYDSGLAWAVGRWVRAT